MMKKLITLIRAKLEYAAVVWSPCRKKDIRKLQRVATKMVPELTWQSYKTSMEQLCLPTLGEGRGRGC